MKNKEKWAKEIVEIAIKGECIAVEKISGKPVSCNDMDRCKDCLFHGRSCSGGLKKWAEEEYMGKEVTQ